MHFRAILLAVALWLSATTVAFASSSFPVWDFNSNSSSALNFPQAAWPAAPANPQECDVDCGEWQPYTRFGHTINDPRIQDPSNGGTSPQNYVNIASSCVDQGIPSIYYNIDSENEILFFRWRVAQIAHTYATGPNAGSAGSAAPWNSALWTVFFDTTGDGYRNYAAHLDGSSGSPSAPIDRLVGIWAEEAGSQSIDYVSNPKIHALGYNPTAFVDPATGRILNFGAGATPTASWPNGSNERLWDYGTTRAQLISQSPGPDACTEYFVDYQIPFAFLDASDIGGPAVGPDTGLSLLFCTANSLNNPLQKDCALQDAWVSNAFNPAPFGDFMTLGGDVYQQPIVYSVAAASCPATLTATVNDALHVVNGKVTPTVEQVAFYYYADSNQNGGADDGNNWVYIGDGAAQGLNRWTLTWSDAVNLPRGSYLIGIQALDRGELNASGKAHRTFSYLTQGEVNQLASHTLVPGNEEWFGNPPVQGVAGTAAVNNSCGQPLPSVSKSVEPAEVSAGEVVTFRVTIHNTQFEPLAVSQIVDRLPTGFVYQETLAEESTLGAASVSDQDGLLTWSFGSVQVPPQGTGTLVFTALAPGVTGTYANVARAETSAGMLESNPAQIGVGAPRLSLSKSAHAVSVSPGARITYTLRYANDSPVNVTGAVIRDALPEGLIFATALDGGVYDDAENVVTWTVGDLAAGEGPYTVRLVATAAEPYPDTAAIPLVNSAVIDADQTEPAQARASVYVNTPRPRLALEKRASTIQATPGQDVMYAIQYRNLGNATATEVAISDAIPAGFGFVTASGNGAANNGVVTWSIGSVAAGDSGVVSLTLKVNEPFSGENPTVNTAVITSAQTEPQTASATVGVYVADGLCQNYYFRRAQFENGMLAGHYIANTYAPDAGTVASVSKTVGTNLTEITRFYSDPVSAAGVNLSGLATISFRGTKTAGPQGYFEVELYSYNPTTGIEFLLGKANHSNQPLTGNDAENFQLSLSTSTSLLPAGSRLLWIIKGVAVTGSSVTLKIDFDSTTYPSHSRICNTAPANLILDKQASSSAVIPGETLGYRLSFANTGSSDATGVTLTDTLPDGVTLVGATLNGDPVTPQANGQELVFSVKSDGAASDGVVGAGQMGELIIEVKVNAPLGQDVAWLTNAASLASDQTAAVEATATSAVLHPRLSVSKQASHTSLIPGDLVTYNITVLNSGAGAATDVTVTDTLPVAYYFTYVSGSVQLNGNPVDIDPVSADTLGLNIGTLAAGASAQVSFQMQVGSGVPDGVTAYDNTAWVDSEQSEPLASDPVAVAISTNPNLRLTKVADMTAPVAPGDLISYTLVVSNIGSGPAQGVTVFDPLPAHTAYVAGSLLVDGVGQSDAADGDAARFDGASNRVVFALDELAAGASHTLQFGVRVNAVLPAGVTPIDNTASASASNSASRTATASTQAEAAPDLWVRKFGPESVAYPAAVVAGSVSNANVLTVEDATQLATGQHVQVGGAITQIETIDGNTVQLAEAVTAIHGAPIVAEILYNIAYGNQGNALATEVELADILPAGAIFIAASDGGQQSKGVVRWSLDTLEAGAAGAVQVRIFPGGPGDLVNEVQLSSAESLTVYDMASTAVGGLRARKYTTTPIVDQSRQGSSAIYVIEIKNTLSSDAEGVDITDQLPDGFTYLETTEYRIADQVIHPPAAVPTSGDEQPSWGPFTISGQSTLAVTFRVAIAPTVGPALYDNFVLVEGSAPTVQFDALGSASEDVVVQATNLHVTKTVNPATVTAGQPVTYTIAVANVGDAAAVTVVIADVLPAGFSYVETTLISEQGANRDVVLWPNGADIEPTWGAWTIQPGGQVTVSFKARTADVTGTFSNTVWVTTDSTSVPRLENVAPVALDSAPIVPLNPPVAIDDAAIGWQGEAVTVDVLVNDAPGDAAIDAATLQIVGGDASGKTLTVAGQGTWAVDAATGAIVFTPESGYTGNPTPIQYVVQDVDGEISNAATVTIVYNAPPVQEPPIQEPPIQEPPIQEPPVQEPPVQQPPNQEEKPGDAPIEEPADVPVEEPGEEPYEPPAEEPKEEGGYTLSGAVWLDLNEDGLLLMPDHTQKPGQGGVTVMLFQASGGESVALAEAQESPYAMTETHEDGRYQLSGLAGGHYYLEFALPQGFSFTTPAVGDDVTVNSQALQPQLGVEIVTVTNGTVQVGSDVVYRLQARNYGTRTAHGVALLIIVPDGASLDLVKNLGWACQEGTGEGGSRCTYALGDVSPGAEHAVQVPLALRVEESANVAAEGEVGVLALNAALTQRTNGRTPVFALLEDSEAQPLNAGVVSGVRFVESDSPAITPIVWRPTNLAPEAQPDERTGFLYLPALQR